jgi:hypothetical protein
LGTVGDASYVSEIEIVTGSGSGTGTRALVLAMVLRACLILFSFPAWSRLVNFSSIITLTMQSPDYPKGRIVVMEHSSMATRPYLAGMSPCKDPETHCHIRRCRMNQRSPSGEITVMRRCTPGCYAAFWREDDVVRRIEQKVLQMKANLVEIPSRTSRSPGRKSIAHLRFNRAPHHFERVAQDKGITVNQLQVYSIHRSFYSSFLPLSLNT